MDFYFGFCLPHEMLTEILDQECRASTGSFERIFPCQKNSLTKMENYEKLFSTNRLKNQILWNFLNKTKNEQEKILGCKN